MTLLLDGANAEAHPIEAAMKMVESIVLVMVYLLLLMMVLYGCVLQAATAACFVFFALCASC